MGRYDQNDVVVLAVSCVSSCQLDAGTHVVVLEVHDERGAADVTGTHTVQVSGPWCN
jgi:hypothetical protein